MQQQPSERSGPTGGRDRIRLTGISATGHHGLFEHERRDGQTFVADVVLHVDTRPAASEDRLALTVDYGVLADQVAQVLSGEPADLIETVAERIAAVALCHPPVLAVDVVLHKPQAPIQVPFGDVTVEIHRDREHRPGVEAPTGVVGLLAGTGAGAHAQPAPALDGPLDLEPVLPAADDTDLGRPMALSELLAPSLAAGALPGPVPAGAVAAGPGPVGAAVTATAEWAPAPPVQAQASATSPVDLLVAPPTHEPADRLDVVPDQPVDVVLALGSNLGSSQDTLREAIYDLDALEGVEVTAISPLARTAAVGGPDQGDYLNAVVLGRSTLSPRDLLRACQAVEARHGRERLVHWGPRTLDIDIVLHGSTMAVADDLELPHPRAHQRAFVLQPWAQVAPDAVLPGLGGGPVADLARTAPDREGIRWMALDWWKQPEAGS